MENLEKIDKLIEVCRLHDARVRSLNDFEEKYIKSEKVKLSKEYYLMLKKVLLENVGAIQREINLWEELGDIIFEDECELPEELLETLKDLHCTREDALKATAGLIQSLENEMDKNFDLLNETKEIIKLIQDQAALMPPLQMNLLFLSGKVDKSVLEIEL